ncbi:MAG: hypothetical protein H3C43_10230 [Leptonema sp. (in: Bacteria)]|nr:hypothetical protein [Leptonema sp. (in: bacteria)]
MNELTIQDQLQQILAQLQRLEAASQPDPIAQIILSLVPVFGIIAGMVVMLVFIRHYYVTRRQLIAAGRLPTPTIRYLRALTLLGGILCISAGLPLTVLFLAVEGVSYSLLGGLIPLFTGIGLLVFFSLSRASEHLE